MKRARLLLMMLIVLLVQVGAYAQEPEDTVLKQKPLFETKYKHRVNIGPSASIMLGEFFWYYFVLADQIYGRLAICVSYEVKLAGRFAPKFALSFERWRNIGGSRQEYSFRITTGFTPKIYLSDSPRLRMFAQPELEFSAAPQKLLASRYNWVFAVGGTAGMDFMPRRRPRLTVTVMFPKLAFYKGHFDSRLDLSSAAKDWGIIIGLPSLFFGYSF